MIFSLLRRFRLPSLCISTVYSFLFLCFVLRSLVCIVFIAPFFHWHAEKRNEKKSEEKQTNQNCRSLADIDPSTLFLFSEGRPSLSSDCSPNGSFLSRPRFSFFLSFYCFFFSECQWMPNKWGMRAPLLRLGRWSPASPASCCWAPAF